MRGNPVLNNYSLDGVNKCVAEKRFKVVTVVFYQQGALLDV